MRYAVVLGRHADVWKELDAAKALVRSVDPSAPITIIATKRCGRDYDGPVHEWPSFHPEFFKSYIEERAKHGRPPALRLWGGKSPNVKKMNNHGLPINWVPSAGGSSGLLGIQVALAIGHPPYDKEFPIDKVILCGCPMEKTAQYDTGKEWKEAEFYRDQWVKYFKEDPARGARVRSMSGWSRKLLGMPDEQWLRAAAA